MAEGYDAIIIGGGHNGLVAAAYLARAKRRVLVLERRALVGGAAVTETLPGGPGFQFSTVADGAGRLFPHIVKDLELARHGLKILPADPVLAAPHPDGEPLLFWRDVSKTAEGLKRFSPADAARYPEFVAAMSGIASVVAGLMTLTPPHVPDLTRTDLMELLKVAGPARRLGKKALSDVLRVLPMPISDLLDEWFESDRLKAALAADGVYGLSLGPRQAGTAYVWLTKLAAGHSGGLPHTGQAAGGMGALTQALARAAQSLGAEIRTGAEVARVSVEAGRARAVILAGGQSIPARVVISNADPRTTFHKLLDPADVDPVFLRDVDNIKYRGAEARVHLAVESLPITPQAPRLRLAPSLEYVERASDAAKYGQFSRQPLLDVSVPTLLDRTLAPPGQHVVSVHAQYAPYHLRAGSWDEQREAFGDLIVEALEPCLPGLGARILQRHTLTPHDLECVYGLPEGSGSHGEMTLDQFLYMRPAPGFGRYRTPLDGLYLCGAGTHPGGGVTGVNGCNAAREVLRDWGR